jgi:hypothetical protein
LASFLERKVEYQHFKWTIAPYIPDAVPKILGVV